MKYYITSDLHSFYTPFIEGLRAAGYYEDTEPHKLIILGDLFDRGKEALKMQEYILQLMERDEVILIRGNHEDSFCDLVTAAQGLPSEYQLKKGVHDTTLQLTGFGEDEALSRNRDFAAAGRETPFFTKIIPAMIDYMETEHYVFLHGWIPCRKTEEGFESIGDWRNALESQWQLARKTNGIDAAQSLIIEKTIVCGHWHTSYGHWKYEKKGPEYGPGEDFSPYYARGIIALDARTVYTGKVNVIVLED